MYKISLILGFICFNCIVSNFLFAQNPGGVEKPIIWKQNIVSDYRESISAETFNFNKYLKIAEKGKELNLPIGNLNKISLFIVFNSENKEDIATIHSGNKEIVITDSTVNSRNKYAYTNTDRKPKILTYVENIKKSNKLDTNGVFRINRKKIDVNETFQGGVAEIIVYDKLLNKNQINKIESYLSIKYGISLPLTSDYYNSLGEIIWNPLQHEGFEYHLTSIGKDKISNLNQLQSRNAYSDFDLTIGLNQITTHNDENKSNILNNSYLFWADNNGSTIYKSKEPNSEILSIDRIWQMEHKGNLGLGGGIEFKVKLKDSLPNPINNTLWLVYSNTKLVNGSSVNKGANMLKLKLDDNNSYTGILNEKFNTCDFYFTFIWSPKINMELYPDAENCSKRLTNAMLEIRDINEDISIDLNGKEIVQNQRNLDGKMSILLENIPYFHNTLRIIVNHKDTLYKFFDIDRSTCRKLQVLQEIDLAISPNPIRAGNYFDVFVYGLKDGPVNLNIYSEQMKFIRSISSHSSNGVISIKEKINIAGVYILEINQDKVSKSGKIIVLN